MDRIDRVGQEIGNHKGFIYNPYSFIYDNYDEVSTSELVEFLKFISVHNRDVINNTKSVIEGLRSELDMETVIPSKKEESVLLDKDEVKTEIEDVSDIVDLLFFSESENDVFNIIKSSKENVVLIKLELLKRIELIKKNIVFKIRSNKLTDISALQEELKKYLQILGCLTKKREQDEEVQEEIEFKNIVFVPNGKNLFIAEDIQVYDERFREIKNVLDKVVDGYFLKTKDVKKIERYKYLFEYKNPNGIRIMFIIENGIISICSLFFKDKQRSIRINNEYEESVKRYLSRREYIMANINNPDFLIEQSEMVGNLYSLFDERTLSKKGGE